MCSVVNISDCSFQDIACNDSVSLLEEDRLKTKSGSLESGSSKTQNSPVSSTVNINSNSAVKYNRTRKNVSIYHRSVSEQDSITDEAIDGADNNQRNPEETDILCPNEIPPADVQSVRRTIPSAPSASYSDEADIHAMETLLITPCDVDDVASLVNHRSLDTNYSEASTVPVRSMCPADGVNDLLSLDTMSDNVLFTALVAEPKPPQNNLSKLNTGRNLPTSNRRGDVDSCPDFGLGVPNNQHESQEWVVFDDDEDFLRPPPTPSMDHIRQLLRYELPLPTARNCDTSRQSTEVKQLFIPGAEHPDGQPNMCSYWKDTEQELFDAENDAEILYKMVSYPLWTSAIMIVMTLI